MTFIRIFVIFLAFISFGDCGVEEWWTREKCIENLGCFYAGKPFFNIIERPLSLLPDDRDTINTKFSFYTTHGPRGTFSNMDSSISYLDASGFSPKINTKFIIPGFMSAFASKWKMALVESLLQSEESNIFLVDWSGGDGPFYEQAVANTRVVGAEIAQFIENIQKKTGLSLDSIHLIGHSLGSHIAGYAGKKLNKIGRITGLDPAGPYFTEVDPVVRLDRSDALFVDAIHTNAAPNRFQGFGNTDSIAHIDFWPNGGHLQPGCPYMGSSILTFLKHPTLDNDGLHDIMCSHQRAIDLFISSINHPDCKLLGDICDNWEEYIDGSCLNKNNEDSKSFLMGMYADKFAQYINDNKSINVFLNTTNAEPFCLN